jgi:putative membrane protein
MTERLSVERYFSAEEQERLKQCVGNVESRTSGEIAIVVAGHSSWYREAEVAGGVILASVVALILTEIFFHSSIWAFIPLSFVLFFPARMLFRRYPALKVRLVGPRRKSQAVRDRAVRTFYEKGLYKTRHHTGVLFYISLVERKVWILADKGIYEKISHATLSRHAGSISKGMREGMACESLCEAIGDVGRTLALHFPVAVDDTNELPDGIIFQRD